MKVRQAIPVTSELGDLSKLAKFDGESLWRSSFQVEEVGLGLNCAFSFWLLVPVIMYRSGLFWVFGGQGCQECQVAIIYL